MKSRIRAHILHGICFALFSVQAITASATDLSSQNFDFTPEKRSEYKTCVTFAKVRYPLSYEKSTRTDATSPEWENMGEDKNYEFPYFPLNKATCDQLNAHRVSYFGSKYMGWYKDADFLLESELMPIKKWTNRFVFLLEDPIYRGPIEYSSTYQERDRETELSATEIATFQETNVKNHTFIFTKDAKIYIRHTASFWKLFLSPTHLVAIDPTGTFLPLLFPRPTCIQDSQELLSCAFSKFNTETGDLEVLKSGSSLFIKIGTSSKNQISITSRPYGIKWKHSNDSLNISSTFDAPIRPVYFEKGVLFSPRAKPNRRGNYKKKDMLPYRVCVADCPEHIKLQEENTPAE